MADDAGITGGTNDASDPIDVEAPELIPGGNGGWWPPRPIVLIIFGGFIAVIVAAILIVLATGDDNDTATDVAVGEPADQAGDEPADTVDIDSSDAGTRSGGEAGDEIVGGDAVGDEVAASESALEFGGGGDWLVPWQDGFLRFGLIFAPQPLPEFDGRFDDLFPPEVTDTLEAAGVTTIDEATDVLIEADLYDQVIEIIDANPEVADWLFGTEPPPPSFEIAQSSDGLDWTALEGISIPGGESIAWVQSDGRHLVVGSQEYGEPDDSSNGMSRIQVAVTSDLRDWDTYDITGTAGENIPDLVQVDTGIGALAIGSGGWIAATNTYAFIDEWALVPEDIREIAETGGWWELSADESGLMIDVFESEFTLVHDEDGNVVDEVFNEECCDLLETRLLPWDQVGLDFATWQEYREGGGGNAMSVWTASWGQAPVENAVPPGYGSLGSMVGTATGFLAVSWPQELEESDGEFSDGNVLLFSPDGRSWTDLPFPQVDGVEYIDQLVAVEGGVIATASGPNGQTLLLGDSDGTNWREAAVPGIPENTWIWFNQASGAATIVDATDYSEFEECHFRESSFVEIDLPEHFVFIESWPDGTSMFIEDHTNETSFDAFSDLSYPESTPDFMSFDDATSEVAFLDPATGDEVVRMPTDDFLTAWDEAAADAEAGLAECAGATDDGPVGGSEASFPVADLWLVATLDGRTWLVEDLDGGGGEMDYPQQAAVNGNVVIARIGDNWSRHTIG